MSAIEPPQRIPLNPHTLLRDKTLTISIAAHMLLHPDSDLLNLITGKISFDGARSDAVPSY